MGLLDFLVLLIIAGICGAIAQALAGLSRGGCLASVALGFIGALLGAWIARALDLPELFAVQLGTTRFPVVWAILGGALFAALLALVSRGRAYRS